MDVREREFNSDFHFGKFGVGNIYHRVRNGERRLTVVSDLRFVAEKAKWRCKTTYVFCDHLTTFGGAFCTQNSHYLSLELPHRTILT